MLTSFKVKGITVPLLPSPNLGPESSSLFAADSMTLLVGPNGSGKTRVMMGLASILARKGATGRSTSDASWDNEADPDSTCAVYYTPVPYHIVPPRNGDRFRFIQTSLSSTSRPMPSEHEEIISRLKTEFELEAPKILSLPEIDEYDFNKVLTQVLAVRTGILDKWIEPFRAATKELRQDKRLSDGTLDWGHIEKNRKKREVLAGEFAKQLREKIGPEFILAIRAFAYASSLRAVSDTAKSQLLGALGFSLRTPPVKKATVPKKNFDSTLAKLRIVAHIVNDPQLSKNTYQLDSKQSDQLNSLELGKVGQVSLTQLSSGAATLIHQFASIDMACGQLLANQQFTNLVLIIDEGDAFLHLAWQQRYIDYLDKTVARLKKKFKIVQVLVATHSPVLMSDFPRDCIYLLDGKNWIEDLLENATPSKPAESFGAPLDAVVRHVGQAGTMGVFSARIIKGVVEEILAGRSVSSERIEMIGDPIIRRQLHKKLQEIGLSEVSI